MTFTLVGPGNKTSGGQALVIMVLECFKVARAVSVAAWRPPRPPIARIAKVGQTRRSASGARDCDGLCGLHAFPLALPGLNGPWAARCQGTCYNWCDCNCRQTNDGRQSFASGTCEPPVMRIDWGHPQWPGSGCIVLRGSLHLDTLSRIMCWAPPTCGKA
jgi:hypothetical protein